MRTSFVAFATAATLFASVGLAHADEVNIAADRDRARCAAAKAEGRMCQIDIEGVTVESDRPSGDGEQIMIAQWTQHESLIRIRFDFIAEILKSADDLL